MNGDRATPDVIVLDTQKDPYEFTAPTVYTNVSIFPSLTYHSANLFGNYMIVAFGNNYLTYIYNIIYAMFTFLVINHFFFELL